MKRPFRAPLAALRAPAAALILLLSAAAAPAQEGAPSADAVVARVDGHEIRVSDVEAAMAELPQEYRNAPPQALFGALLEQLIDRRLLLEQARARNLRDDLDVQRRLRQLEARVLEQAYLRHVIDSKVTEEAVRRRYEQEKENMTREKQVRARHILVKTREEAVEILRELSRGKDFAELAREKSIGPSKVDGGDLGFFTRDGMLPAFSQMAFSLREGEVARAPVQTQYGWHVIKVEEIREAAPPSFEEVKGEIRAQMADEAVEAELERLRKEARIERPGAEAAPDPAMPGAPSPEGGDPAPAP